MIRRALVSSLIAVGFACASPPVQSKEERFRLIGADSPERLESRLRVAGGEGYALVGAARGVSAGGEDRTVVLVERGADRRPVDFAVVATSGAIEQERDAAIHRLAAEGYRLSARGVVVRETEDFWLPETSYDDQMILVLERRTDDRTPRRYVSVPFGSYDRFYRALDDRLRDGFEVLGLWNSGRRLQVLLEGPPPGETGEPNVATGSYRLLMRSTRSALRQALRRAASDGYRVVAAADPSVKGPPLLLLQRLAPPGKELSYRFFPHVPEKLLKDRMDRKLNRRVQDGWRPCPRGSTDTVVTLQRPRDFEPSQPGAAVADVFLALVSTDSGFHDRLERALAEGYAYLAMYVEPGQTTVLLQKPDGNPEKTDRAGGPGTTERPAPLNR